MKKKTYLLTDQAPIELRRLAVGGKISLTDRGAEYELLRGTIRPEAKPAAPVAAARATTAAAD